MFVNVNGIKIWCDSEGEGIPMILPSYSGVPYLQRAIPTTLRKFFKMIFIEPRGGGRSDSGEEITLENIVNDIDEVRKVFNIEKAFLFGWSANAYITLEYASKYPDNVLGLILISMPPKYNDEMIRKQDQYWEEFADENRKAVLEENHKNLKEAGTKGAAINDKIINEYVANGSKYFFDPKFDSSDLWRDQQFNYKNMQFFYGDLLLNYDAVSKLNEINTPIVSFNGKYDFIVPHENAMEFLRSKENAEVNVFEESGHYPFMEEEDKFIKILMPWINKNNS
ncbi:MAG: alpha/beta hydrolase [Melioribacteraceae bacterium]|nr:alpha/beta hydrolase [Melioribacteraceae bacterium]